MLENRLSEDLKTALKAGEKTKVSTLRMIISSVKNKKIEEGVKEAKDDTVLAVLQKMARQYKESIEKFKEGGREDLMRKEMDELAVLEQYLPQQLSPEEIEKLVDEAIKGTGASGAKDMGKVMKEVMARTKGRADGKSISDTVKRKLG